MVPGGAPTSLMREKSILVALKISIYILPFVSLLAAFK